MSLLLEALKKAERAKEEAQRSARGEASELRLESEAAPGADAKHVLTRDELPDISQPLEIASDDLAPQAASEAPSLALADESAPARPATASRTAAKTPAADTQAAERAAAKKVFEAKFREPNPRLPFYVAVGVLGVFALGTVVYFWLQLRPAPALVNANPQRPAGEAPAAVAAARPASAAPAPAVQTAAPGLPEPASLGEAPPSPAAAATPAVPAPAAKPAPAGAPPQASRAVTRSRAPAPERRTDLSVRSGALQVHPRVESGYAAFLGGDLAAARADYQQVLKEEPANRDALLGLAAVELRAGRSDAAEALYLRLLQADPRDPHAQANLIVLRSGRIDPVVAESRIKSLIGADPEAHALHFALGNQYARQGRWAEAQQAYFKAVAADPDNPDFAFNLAVSLDHLRQPGLALEYYRRALALADKRDASFDRAMARDRVQQLAR